MDALQQCVLPEECRCQESGATYWPGQLMKVGCDICVCERGRARRCRPNPDCPGTVSLLLSSPAAFTGLLRWACTCVHRAHLLAKCCVAMAAGGSAPSATRSRSCWVRVRVRRV